ncbi:kinase-like domain-containing protein [Aspergillus aurantiobrunneus]
MVTNIAFMHHVIASWSILQLSTTCSSASFSTLPPFPNITTVDAEPLHRYRQGGYHPVTLGSFLGNNRDKILHKLGWGGSSTVWAARDRTETYIAIKICVSERDNNEANKGLNVMTKLASIQPGPRHIVRLLDDFDLVGPNGTHKCLVFEFLGPSIPETIDVHYPDGRLPGRLAKTIAKQALVGLDSLHQHNIGHGVTVPCVSNVSEDEFINILGKAEIGHVQRIDGKDLEPGVPDYVVRPASYHSRFRPSLNSVKIVDFGELFSNTAIPQTLHTPLPVRAPEVIFGERLDYRVDLWSMGCMLFELFVGQPPFDSFFITPKALVGQMQEMAGDALPERWQNSWRTMDDKPVTQTSGPTLQEWLEEMYFGGERKEDLTKEDIVQLGQIIRKLLRFEPSTRASAREILNHPWFSCDPHS